MTIPDFQSLMRPVLAYLADGDLHRSRDVKASMADLHDLSDAERAELLPSGRHRTLDNRVGWSLTYLSQAGLVERPVRGQVRITDLGRAALASNQRASTCAPWSSTRPIWSSASAPARRDRRRKPTLWSDRRNHPPACRA